MESRGQEVWTKMEMEGGKRESFAGESSEIRMGRGGGVEAVVGGMEDVTVWVGKKRRRR